MAPSVPFTLQSSPEVLEYIRHIHWTDALLEKFGIIIDDAFAAKALEPFWELHQAGETGHVKKYVDFEEDNAHWHQGNLVGFVGGVSGMKDIHFGPTNKETGMPISHADAMLRDKVNGIRFLSVEAIKGSDLRTGWFASEFARLVLRTATNVNVTVLGAGPIAEACIRMLNLCCKDTIGKVTVMSLGGFTCKTLAEKLAPKLDFTIEASTDRDLLRKSEYIITATNAGKPVLDVKDIGENTKILSQGIDDLSPELIEELIKRKALFIGDDLQAMEDRNVDPLAFYYSRKGQRLTVEGRRDGAVEYGELESKPYLRNLLHHFNGPACFLPVGLVGYDLKILVEVFNKLDAYFANMTLSEASEAISRAIAEVAAASAAAETNA